MNEFESKFQIGKNGLTQGTITSLNSALKTHKRVRISVLKSACRDRSELKKMAEEICSKIKEACGYKIIGYTIILKRQK
tara:strand:- start:5231 stop:5467 length:237 start_codon:yes stop_codon:yes gene_type:complete